MREYHFLRALGQHFEVTHLFFSEPGSPDAAGTALPFCARTVAVPAPRPYTLGMIARGLLGRWPLPVVNYISEGMRDAVAAAAGEHFDLVHIESIHLSAYVPVLRRKSRAPVIYNWHNIESEAMRRFEAIAGSPLRRIYAAATARKLAALEDRVLHGEFGHVVCSERERAELARRAPEARIAVVANGVDARFFDTPGGSFEGRRRILFVGAMAYHANIEAVVRFARSVWPAVRQRFPEWRLTLVGSNPVPAVLALRGEKNVEVTGTVADVRPYYREALAAIVPVRTGSGTRLKILEAMAAGVPVVSTRLGAEGFAVSPGADILIAETEAEWLHQFATLYRSEALWQRLAEKGRELARSYDWDALGNSLHETYRRWLRP